MFKKYLLVDCRIGAQHGDGVYDCQKDIESPAFPKCLRCSGLSLCVSYAMEKLCFSVFNLSSSMVIKSKNKDRTRSPLLTEVISRG